MSNNRKCIETYEPRRVGEIALRVGDVLEVHSQESSGWYKGVNLSTNQNGIFPVAYTSTLQRAPNAPPVVPRHQKGYNAPPPVNRNAQPPSINANRPLPSVSSNASRPLPKRPQPPKVHRENRPSNDHMFFTAPSEGPDRPVIPVRPKFNTNINQKQKTNYPSYPSLPPRVDHSTRPIIQNTQGPPQVNRSVSHNSTQVLPHTPPRPAKFARQRSWSVPPVSQPSMGQSSHHLVPDAKEPIRAHAFNIRHGEEYEIIEGILEWELSSASVVSISINKQLIATVCANFPVFEPYPNEFVMYYNDEWFHVYTDASRSAFRLFLNAYTNMMTMPVTIDGNFPARTKAEQRITVSDKLETSSKVAKGIGTASNVVGVGLIGIGHGIGAGVKGISKLAQSRTSAGYAAPVSENERLGTGSTHTTAKTFHKGVKGFGKGLGIGASFTGRTIHRGVARTSMYKERKHKQRIAKSRGHPVNENQVAAKQIGSSSVHGAKTVIKAFGKSTKIVAQDTRDAHVGYVEHRQGHEKGEMTRKNWNSAGHTYVATKKTITYINPVTLAIKTGAHVAKGAADWKQEELPFVHGPAFFEQWMYLPSANDESEHHYYVVLRPCTLSFYLSDESFTKGALPHSYLPLSDIKSVKPSQEKPLTMCIISESERFSLRLDTDVWSVDTTPEEVLWHWHVALENLAAVQPLSSFLCSREKQLK